MKSPLKWASASPPWGVISQAEACIFQGVPSPCVLLVGMPAPLAPARRSRALAKRTGILVACQQAGVRARSADREGQQARPWLAAVLGVSIGSVSGYLNS